MRSRTPTILALLLAVGWPFLAMLFGRGPGSEDITNFRQDVEILLIEWAVALTLLAIIVFWERRPLNSVGVMRGPSSDWLAAFLVLVFTMLATVIISSLAHLKPMGPDLVRRIGALPLWLRIGLALTAGFCEELSFRGYAIERLRELTGSLWAGAVISWLLFGFAHIPRYGLNRQLLIVFVMGGGLTILYTWRRKLLVNVAVHAIIDGITLLVLPYIAAQHGVR